LTPKQKDVANTDLIMIGIIVLLLIFANTLLYSTISQILSVLNLIRNAVILGATLLFGLSYYYVRFTTKFEKGEVLMKWAFLYLGFSLFAAGVLIR